VLDGLVRKDPAAAGVIEPVRERLREHARRSQVSLALVGQYNAGKSTIVSALTGRSDIRISADIATDECTPYEWLGLRLVDTPGLYTERPDHDRITNEEIERSDLLAFCLTNELFDHITLSSFRELAHEKLYASKMLLVVNKLFAEAGDVDERVSKYRANLDQMLGTAELRQIPKVFLDAQLYRNGLERGSEQLRAMSRFGELVGALNKLSDERGLLSRADTPFRIVLGGVNEAILALSGGDDTDKTAIHLFNRFLNAVGLSRSALRREFTMAADEAARVVQEEGETLLAAVNGMALEQFPVIERACHERIRQRLDQTRESLQGMILAVGLRLQSDAKDIEALPLFTSFAARIDVSANIAAANVEIKGMPRLRSQLPVLQNIAFALSGMFSAKKGALKGVPQAATQPGLGGHRAVSGVLDAADSGIDVGAAGAHLPHAASYLDDTIQHTIQHLNDKFHWHLSADGALHATHRMNDIMSVVGPALALVSAGVSVYGMVEEKKATEALGKLRIQLQENVAEAGEKARGSFETLGAEIDSNVFRPLENDIRSRRDEAEHAIESGNSLVGELRELRNRLETNLREIASVAG
jgi:50S ribosome-binding GTPase